MANLHSRSNSFPSLSHPATECVEDILCRIKSCKGISTSAFQLCANLASLRDLHGEINNMIHMPSIQQALPHDRGQTWIRELLGSLSLVDHCGSSRDIVWLTKESVQDLESAIGRNRVETATANEMNAYMASRKKNSKMAKSCLKNLKSSTGLPKKGVYYVKAIRMMLTEVEALDFSVLKPVFIVLS